MILGQIKYGQFEYNINKLGNFNFQKNICAIRNQKKSPVSLNLCQKNMETGVTREIRFSFVSAPPPPKFSNYINTFSKEIGSLRKGKWLTPEDFKTNSDLAQLTKIAPSTKKKLFGIFEVNNSDFEKSLFKHRQDQLKSIGIQPNIKLLFHGTDRKNLLSIMHPIGGFANAGVSNGSAYGKGIYFANKPDYCLRNGYAKSGDDKICAVICANVITGDTDDDSSSSKSFAHIGPLFSPGSYTLTGGNKYEGITVVWHNNARTDIFIKYVAWYL